MQLWLFIVSSFIGVIVGAYLQYLLGRRAEHERNIHARRTEAYVDLIKALAAISRPASVTDEQSRQARILYAEARTRVVIYGSAKVVSAVAAFLRLSDFESEQGAAALANIVKAMRVDGLGDGPMLPDSEIARVLFAQRSA